MAGKSPVAATPEQVAALEAKASHQGFDHEVVNAGFRGQACGERRASTLMGNFEGRVVHACSRSRDAGSRSASCAFETRKKVVVFEMDMLVEVDGCQRCVGAPLEARGFSLGADNMCRSFYSI